MLGKFSIFCPRVVKFIKIYPVPGIPFLEQDLSLIHIFEVRDVHYSHYGRMCPIETPEGPNIGLISYLATFARINQYGFIEAPYRRVDKETGIVTNEVVYMTADMEDEYIVAQANEPLDENGRFLHTKVNARSRDEFVEVERERADFMDVSPRMVVSVATAMIPLSLIHI